jgi:hypothetical protein
MSFKIALCIWQFNGVSGIYFNCKMTKAINYIPMQDLEIFSFGGDEVAKGAWERSPKCIEFMNTHAGIKSISDIKEYFAGRVGDIVGNPREFKIRLI